MTDNMLPRILTSKEMADYLKIDEAAILRELESGKLRGFRIGKEWRCTEEDLLAYIRGGSVRVEPFQLNPIKTPTPKIILSVAKIDPFDFHWPKSGGGSIVEHYDEVYEISTNVRGQEYTFKVGFGKRRSAGMLRRRVTIWLGHRAIVEFAGSNDYENDGLLAGIIKLKNGKQLTTQRIPEEYRNSRIERYNSIIQGPKASTGMAVIINKDDFQSMLEHAIIRATWKELIK